MKKQQGLTLISMVFFATIFCFVAVVSMRLIPLYLENYNIVSSMKSLTPAVTKADLISSLERRLMINEVRRIKREQIQIKNVKSGYKVRIAYDITLKMFGNVDAVVHFDDHVVVPYGDS